jgi:hypothetical protein
MHLNKKLCKDGEDMRMDFHGMRANLDNLKDEIKKLTEFKEDLCWYAKEDFEIQLYFILKEFENVLGCNEQIISTFRQIDSENKNQN